MQFTSALQALEWQCETGVRQVFRMYRGRLHFVICLHTNIGTCPAVNFKPTWMEIINFVPSCWIQRSGFTPSKALGTGHSWNSGLPSTLVSGNRPLFHECPIRGPYIPRKAVPEFFLCIFSSLTCLKKPVFIKGDLMQWKVQARSYWDLLTSGTYEPAWKHPSSALRMKRTWVQALLLYITCIGVLSSHTYFCFLSEAQHVVIC